MDSSRRAVESYWRSRMIDGATSDEDKVAPVYKLEEICELLRSSHVSIVKEVSAFILKRLEHKNPIVKQKALRLIKYAVGKSGVEFRREMQRNSVAIRQLFHYKGQLDPLKGDALNKAVRDTAHEAITAIFASEESKLATATEDINRRIQGFGNTNFEMPMENKKSFLSEVVGLGSASIRQGLNTITAAHSLRKNDSGSYKSPNLHRSLNTVKDGGDRYERDEPSRGNWSSSSSTKNVVGSSWSQDPRPSMTDAENCDSSSSHTGVKSHEERLLETIVTCGGVRLQPSRDALQVFLSEASKLDATALSQALHMKLQSHLWQVRMKAVCVLESILWKKDDAHFAMLASYFSENRDVVVRCSESPQASLSEKASKVLRLLDGEQATGSQNIRGQSSSVKTEKPAVFQMPDLIDTGEPDDYGREDFSQGQTGLSTVDLTSGSHVVDDLFADGLLSGPSTSEDRKEDDPFADVSFHTTEDKEHVDNLFSGLTIDDKQSSDELNMQTNKHGVHLFDVFGSSSEQFLTEAPVQKKDGNDLLAGLPANAAVPEYTQQGAFGGAFSEAPILDQKSQLSNPAPTKFFNGVLGSPTVGINPLNSVQTIPLGSMQYNMHPSLVFNPAFVSQPFNYSAMGNFVAQQQLLATVPNFRQLRNLNAQGNSGLGGPLDNGMGGEYTSPIPDIFQLGNNQAQNLNTTTTSTKKEETKAFDFISDHLSAARDSKRVV